MHRRTVASLAAAAAALITVVAAAANDSGSAAKRVPASYNEVITVSALADTDATFTCASCGRCSAHGPWPWRPPCWTHGRYRENHR